MASKIPGAERSSSASRWAVAALALVVLAPLACAQTSYNMYYTASTTPLSWTSPQWVGAHPTNTPCLAENSSFSLLLPPMV